MDAPGFQNGSKIALLSIGWYFDPLKMASGRRFGKNMKIQWKIENRSKNAFLRIGWHFDPLKMASGRGLGKNKKIE